LQKCNVYCACSFLSKLLIEKTRIFFTPWYILLFFYTFTQLRFDFAINRSMMKKINREIV